MFSLIYTWTSGWVNNRDAGVLRRHGANYDVIVMNNGEEDEHNQSDSDDSDGPSKSYKYMDVCMHWIIDWTIAAR